MLIILSKNILNMCKMYLNLTKWSSYFRNYQNYKGHNGIIMLHQAEIGK